MASGGIKQVEIALDRIPHFVLRVTAIATMKTGSIRKPEKPGNR
jgi:hypothetical protein